MSLTIPCILCGEDASIIYTPEEPRTWDYPGSPPELNFEPSCLCQTHEVVDEGRYIELMDEAAWLAVKSYTPPDDDRY